MDDLPSGTRVRHIHWRCTGTEICWDGSLVADEVSPEGVVFPSDLEIIGRAP